MTTAAPTATLSRTNPAPIWSRIPSRAAAPLTVSTAVVGATSMAVDAEVRGMVRPKAPNYALRRVLAATGAVLVLAIGAIGSLGLLAGLGSSPASASAGQPAAGHGEARAAAVVAAPGDSLWSIASAHRGEIAHGRYLDALLRLNDGASVQVGQLVLLP